MERSTKAATAGTGTASNTRAHLLDAIPASEARAEPAGVRTALLEGGDGPPLLLLHGPGESSLWWMRAIPRLVSTHRVIVPDLPGHGASDMTAKAGNAGVDPEQVMRWLGALIDERCSQPPVLVGHLLGGAIAARFAVRHSARLKRLVLVDSFGLGAFRPSPRFAFRLLRFLARPSEKSYDRFLPHCMYDAQALRSGMGDRWTPFLSYNLERAAEAGSKAVMKSYMKQFGTVQIPPADLARIEAPTALIWGRHDKAVRLRIAKAAAARYGWPLHIIDDARDDPKLEQPEAFVRALNAVMESTTAAS